MLIKRVSVLVGAVMMVLSSMYQGSAARSALLHDPRT